MQGKEIKCTCNIVYKRVLLISGILAGILLVILGITTITGDTANLFPTGFFRWYSGDVYTVKFTDEKAFPLSISNGVRTLWARPQDKLVFEWTTRSKSSVIQCDAYFQPIADGLRSDYETQGKVTFDLDDLPIAEYYFCRSTDNRWCTGYSGNPYRMRLIMYKDQLFRTNGYLGNQNYRWSFFVLALLTVVFGVIMVLGELHVPFVTTKFTFFYFSFVKGLVYIAVGFLVMGMSNIFGLFAAFVMWAVGVVNCIYGWKSLTTFNWKGIGATGTTTIVTRREYI